MIRWRRTTTRQDDDQDDDQDEDQDGDDQDEDDQDEEEDEFHEADYDESPRPPDGPYRLPPLRIALGTGSSSRIDQYKPKPKWSDTFRLLYRQDFGEQRRRLEQFQDQQLRRAWYVLDVSTLRGSSALVIDLYCQDLKKNGEYGKIKRLRFNDTMTETFADACDRQVLPELAACSRDASQANIYSPFRTTGGLTTLELQPVMYAMILPKLSDTGRLRWMRNGQEPVEESQPLAWDDGDPWDFRLRVEPDQDAQQWLLLGEFVRDDEAFPIEQVVCNVAQHMVLTQTHLRRLKPDISKRWIHWAQEHNGISIPYAERDTFLKLLLGAPYTPQIEWPENIGLEQIEALPVPCLRIRESRSSRSKQDTLADVRFLYGHEEVATNNYASVIPERAPDDGRITAVRARHWEYEDARLHEVASLPSVSFYSTGAGVLQLNSRAIPEIARQLLAKGWRVEAAGRRFRNPGEFQIQVNSGIDWFDLAATIDFDGQTASLPDLLNAVRRGDKYVVLGDGSHGMLPEEWLERYLSFAQLGAPQDDTVRFQHSQALLLDTLLAEQQNLQVDKTFQRMRDRLHAVDGVTPRNAPRSFQGTLREYQREGLGWFKFLDDLAVGGCLADDMGLGKTVQVLALLEAHRVRRLKQDEQRLPSLAIVPKSLIFNWMDEAARFTPKLQVLNYTGIDRKTLLPELDKANLVLTTYGTLRRDILQLRERQFNFVILDEAQAIKNAKSQSAKASLLLRARRRLALTGTPIENHLGELWSLFEFLNPGMLGNAGAFTAVCANARKDDGQSLSELSRAIAPFVLRRTKQQVLTELPEKTEQTIYCELSPAERKAYNELRDYYRSKLSNVINERGLQRSKIHVLEALLRLRQVACHRGLVNPSLEREPSAKIDTLLEQLEEIIGEGHKALVFSQFTSLLAIVRKRLDSRAIRYEYLDGQTRNRKEIVDRFQQPDGRPVFLISLKAGGQGLNLTEADYVFILDPWWNPAVEMQAIDRAHRIGQTQPVFAYRIIARDTVEEKVLDLQDSKRELADAIITANDSLIRKLTAQDLQRILS